MSIPTRITPALPYLAGFAAGPYAALTAAVQVIVVSDAVANDALASGIPIGIGSLLSWLHGEIDTIAGGATSIIWRVCADSAGDHAITHTITTAIVVGATMATDGGVAETLGITWVPSSIPGSVAGQLFVVAATNVGTCRLKPRLYFSTTG
jgi:hypothetical protein